MDQQAAKTAEVEDDDYEEGWLLTADYPGKLLGLVVASIGFGLSARIWAWAASAWLEVASKAYAIYHGGHCYF